MRLEFLVKFYGHKNIRSTHRNTIEVTCEKDLTPSGDCIVGVGSECGCLGLPKELKTALQRPGSAVKITVCAGGESFEINAHGSSDLILSHATDIVIRKSSFVCPRTLAIGSDFASDSIPRSMVLALQNPECCGNLIIRVS